MQLETVKKFSGLDPAIGSNESKEERGVIIVEPAVKTLACGETGAGALAELDDIIRAVRKCLVRWESYGRTANSHNVVRQLDNAHR